MQPIGFFVDDVTEAANAYEEHVASKRRPPEGVEIVAAGPNQGLGDNMRAVSALNRMDIPMLWRAVIRAPQKRKGGPVVSILAPRNQSSEGRASELASAGLSATSVETTAGSIECELAPGTPATSLVQFAVAAIQQLSQGASVSGEWQWTVRKRGLVPE